LVETHALVSRYPVKLRSYSISQQDFLAFIDHLHIASTANQPLKVLNMVGGAFRMVPNHWAQLAGFVIQTTAQLGPAAVSKDRMEIYIKEANKTFLASRGLKFSIASSEALRAILQIPQDEPSITPD
jgi:hypothetical protein